MLQLLLILLLVVASVGWFWGYNYRLQQEVKEREELSPDYFLGVNYLLNEQPDKALETFIKATEINTSTLDIYLALGNLFRKQGKIDRALKVHKVLLAYPNLDKRLRTQVELELAEDYLAGGVFNQAEQKLLALVSIKEQEKKALLSLLKLYQAQKEWEKVIEVALKLHRQEQNIDPLLLEHCYCELGGMALRQGNEEEALRWLMKGLQVNSRSVRGGILIGEVYLLKQEYARVLIALEGLLDSVQEAHLGLIRRLIEGYYRAKQDYSLSDFLAQQYLTKKGNLITGMLLVESYLVETKMSEAATLLWELLTKYPDKALVLNKLCQLEFTVLPGILQRHWEQLQESLQIWGGQPYLYVCKVCKFSSHNFFWLCPGCQNWETIG